MQVWKAQRIAEEAHAGMVDKQGEPYIGHPARVAQVVGTIDYELVPVGWLHDVIEDTDITLDELRAEGLTDRQAAALDAMTRREGETYRKYIERVYENPDARRIKRADIADNVSPDRRFPGDEGLRLRYKEAIGYLLTGKWIGTDW